MKITIGVLALQGDVREHSAALEQPDVQVISVRRRTELAQIDALVIPGGESTTISRLLDVFELREPIADRIKAGMPVYGSCAGMIMLANQVLDGHPDQRSLGGIDMVVRRNAFGRQIDSFETMLDMKGVTGSIPAVFIRAPWVESTGPDVEQLAVLESDEPSGDRIVAVRQGSLLATSFHPEITGDRQVHHYFVSMVREAVKEKS
ncbi:MAG: pyridoxal 5'-phosphate synthase glutaminase subunit PdxT [Corynebacteriales bacterium]|nr:pyridoxal 5'-phosphate synthase glutaminase subunit PdxT [Mycobacteriales bacterium]